MKKIVEYLPIFSGLLIFVGFLNYTTYYRFFDIEIINFLTSGELLLSFLPLTWPILFILLLITIIVIIEIVPINSGSLMQSKSDGRISLWSVFLASDTWPQIKDSWKSRRTLGGRGVIDLAVSLLFFLFGIGIIAFFIVIFFFILPLGIETRGFPILDKTSVVITCLLWFLLLLDIVIVSERKGRIRHAGWVSLYILFIGFVFFISLFNKMDATDVLKGKARYHVKFEFGDKVIKTDSNLVYVGSTANYLFLRDLQLESNSIYQLKDIRHIEFSKLATQ